jgi:hypothetical protein
MKLGVLLGALAIGTVQASELDCLSRIVYREAGGNSIEAAAITAHATINRGKRQRTTSCGLIRKGVVKAKLIPASLRPYFHAVAKAAMKTRVDISHGADSWNRGRRPRYKGAVKRYAGGQVYYTLANKHNPRKRY